MVFFGGAYYTPGAAREKGIPVAGDPTSLPVPEPANPIWQPRSKKSVEERMNRLETRFWAYLRKNPDRFASPMAQPLKLRLGNDCLYCPDFSAIMEAGSGPQFCLFETKGKFTFEDAKVKIKVAASMFPWWPFYLVTQLPSALGFHITRIQP